MPETWGFSKPTAAKLRVIADRTEIVGAANTQRLNRPQYVGGAAIKRYMLLSDMTSNGPVYSQEVNQAGTVVSGAEKIQLWGVQSLLNGAQAGYIVPAAYDADGKLTAMVASCVTSCATSGTITVGTPPAGTVGVSYSHTVSKSGLSPNTLTFAGLPPGLTGNASTGAITGTPTTAGTYIGSVVGTAAKTGGGTCTITKELVIVINGA